jgi:hypothetical protein
MIKLGICIFFSNNVASCSTVKEYEEEKINDPEVN